MCLLAGNPALNAHVVWFTTLRGDAATTTSEVVMGVLSRWLRVLGTVLLTLAMWTGSTATANADFEQLMVPSGAMGRDIPVAFQAGGPQAVYLLDAFNAHPEVSNWVTAGNAMNTLAGSGLSVVAPAGGAYSMYTNWEKDGSKQWETFLAHELPDWLAANKGLAPGMHAVVGAAQGGYAAMALACFHPDRFGYAGSMTGILYPSSTQTTGSIISGMQQFGGVDPYGMWGAPQLGRWKWHDPYVHSQLLVSNNTRIWLYAPAAPAPDPAATIGYEGEAAGSARFFYQQYRSQEGHNGHFNFEGGENGWGSWGPELAAMRGDIVAAIG